jgi:hypothetical protein
MNALARILSYLYGTQDLGITLMPGVEGMTAPVLEVWCDAAYASYADGKSHTGYGFTFQGTKSGLFYCRSKKASNVAQSSTESELDSAVEAANDAVWFRGLMEEIGFPQLEPTPFFTDNESLITLASNFSGNHKRVKHFIMRLGVLIDLVKKGIIVFLHVNTKYNTVDGLTKPLGPTEGLPKRDLLLGVPSHV